MKNSKGFTLIEIMIVVVIIGIIAGVAIPSYQDSIIRASRSEGMTAMLDMMRAQEDFFANNFTYTTDLTELNYPMAIFTTDGGRYNITASLCADAPITECILLTGDAIGGQTPDGDLTLDNRGNRTRNGAVGWTN